jgi:hypothetical protein
MRWEEAKRYARKKCFYRKLLHQYGYTYISTIGYKVDVLIDMLKNIDHKNKKQLTLF